MAVLQTEPLGWASRGARILSEGREIAELQISTFRGTGSFELDGEAFAIEPRGFFRKNAVLKKGGTVIARVEKTSVMRRRFKVSSAEHSLSLVARGMRGREYALLLGERELGRIRREGFAGRRMLLDLPDDIPIPLQVLFTYVVGSQARREAAAAAAGS